MHDGSDLETMDRPQKQCRRLEDDVPSDKVGCSPGRHPRRLEANLQILGQYARLKDKAPDIEAMCLPSGRRRHLEANSPNLRAICLGQRQGPWRRGDVITFRTRASTSRRQCRLEAKAPNIEATFPPSEHPRCRLKQGLQTRDDAASLKSMPQPQNNTTVSKPIPSTSG
jgi:hypothetical protein